MSDPIESYEYNGHVIDIVYDNNPDDPRNWDNLGTMICFHRRYSLGDRHDYKSEDFSDWGEVYRGILKDTGPAIILPLYLYDHSIQSISTKSFYGRAQHATWDSGQIGWIVCPDRKIREEFGVKRISAKLRARVTERLINEVETYDHYIQGDVFGYVIDDDESCYGYYGIDECESEAQAAVDATIESE